MGFFNLDDDEKVRIRYCIKETKNKKKYQNFNFYINKIMPQITRKFSFRIASGKDYKHGFMENNIHLKNCYNHNNRIANFTKDFINLLESNYHNKESNEYKTYTDIPNKITKNNHNVDLTREIKITQQKLNRVLKKIYILEKKSGENIENLSKKELTNLIKARQKHNDLMQYLQNLQAKKKKNIRKNATAFKEIVLNIDKHHTIKDIEMAYKKAQDLIPKLKKANFINVAIHRDEGHFNKITDEPIVNYHAHLLLNNLDENNKTIFRQLTRAELSKIQDIMAESLQMERGVRNSNNKHKTKWQLDYETKKHIAKIRELLPQVEKEINKDKENEVKYYKDFVEWYVKDRNSDTEFLRDSLAKKIKDNTLESYLDKYDKTALIDYKVYLLRKQEKQTEQEKANMSLEQKQQQSIEQPELTAYNYVNKLYERLFELENNQHLSNINKTKKQKPICVELLNYAKKLKKTDQTTYGKVSQMMFSKDYDLIEVIEKNLEIIKESEKNIGMER